MRWWNFTDACCNIYIVIYSFVPEKIWTHNVNKLTGSIVSTTTASHCNFIAGPYIYRVYWFCHGGSNWEYRRIRVPCIIEASKCERRAEGDINSPSGNEVGENYDQRTWEMAAEIAPDCKFQSMWRHIVQFISKCQMKLTCQSSRTWAKPESRYVVSTKILIGRSYLLLLAMQKFDRQEQSKSLAA